MTLRDRLIALSRDKSLPRFMRDTEPCRDAVAAIALAAAKMALTDYAERMDRAKQPAAALGALLLRDGLD